MDPGRKPYEAKGCLTATLMCPRLTRDSISKADQGPQVEMPELELSGIPTGWPFSLTSRCVDDAGRIGSRVAASVWRRKAAGVGLVLFVRASQSWCLVAEGCQCTTTIST